MPICLCLDKCDDTLVIAMLPPTSSLKRVEGSGTDSGLEILWKIMLVILIWEYEKLRMAALFGQSAYHMHNDSWQICIPEPTV